MPRLRTAWRSDRSAHNSIRALVRRVTIAKRCARRAEIGSCPEQRERGFVEPRRAEHDGRSKGRREFEILARGDFWMAEPPAGERRKSTRDGPLRRSLTTVDERELGDLGRCERMWRCRGPCVRAMAPRVVIGTSQRGSGGAGKTETASRRNVPTCATLHARGGHRSTMGCRCDKIEPSNVNSRRTRTRSRRDLQPLATVDSTTIVCHPFG